MDDRNYLNAPVSLRDQPIYRIVSVERLFELFEKRQNVLVKPKKWQDPFENFIMRSQFRLRTGELATLAFRDHFYGQCWTLHRASDAMWRIYSPRADAVRIRTTICKLAESLAQTCGEWAHTEAFVGRVRYLPSKVLKIYAINVFDGVDAPSSRMFAETLLVKRPAFAHEREVRLLFHLHDDIRARDDLYAYPIDPDGLIDQIMIDPRMAERDVNALRSKIRSETSFKGPIKRSLLYAAPPDMILPFG